VSVPGLHIPASIWLTRGASQTFPVLEIDGQRIGDSTAIIAVLEERFQTVVERTTPGPLTKVGGGAVAYARTYTGLRFGVKSEQAAEVARGKVLAALDRLDGELGSGEYLVGDSFSVADLTAASLFYPLVIPDEGPLPEEEPPPAGMERFREPLEQRAGYQWVEEMFRRHRRPSGAPAAMAASQG